MAKTISCMFILSVKNEATIDAKHPTEKHKNTKVLVKISTIKATIATINQIFHAVIIIIRF